MTGRGRGLGGLIALTVAAVALWCAPAALATPVLTMDDGFEGATVVVGQQSTTGPAVGRLTIRNLSTGTPANDIAGPIHIDSISATLACKNNTNPCTDPDTGVFSFVSGFGNGVNSGCGSPLAASAPNPATDAITLTASSGGNYMQGTPLCFIDIYFNVNQMPTDVDSGTAGVQTYQQFHLEGHGQVSGSPTSDDSSAIVTVTQKATPAVSASFGSSTAGPTDPFTFGAQISGIQTGGSGAQDISFKVYGPTSPNCTTPWGLTGLLPVSVSGNGSYDAGTFSDFTIPHDPGVYKVVATYSGNTYNNSVITDCNAPGNTITVSAPSNPGGGGGGTTPGGTIPGANTPPGAPSTSAKCKKKKKGKKRALVAKKKKKCAKK